MDVARYGDYATLAYTNAKVQENYRRRFRITFPNEELPGRPAAADDADLRPADRPRTRCGARRSGSSTRCGSRRPGLEPKEDVTFRRSNAWECVAEEVAAVRERVGMTEISNYAKYRVTGPGAEAWLSSLLTARMPAPGRITLTAMLNEAGRIVGEFTVARAVRGRRVLPVRLAAGRGPPLALVPPPPAGGRLGPVRGARASGSTGLSVTGPRSRDVLAAVAPDLDLSTEAFPFMTFRQVDLGMIPAHLARINYSGDLGYELWVAPEHQRALFDRIVEAGEPHGLRLFGMRALMSLRLEKSYGTWFREYRPIYTPAEGGITRYIKLDHEFIGRAAHEAEVAAGGPKRRLVAFVVEPDPDDPADVIGDEPVWHDGAVVGWVTSGGYGHHVEAVDRAGLRPDRARHARRPGRRRFRDRDHRATPAGPAPARAAVRPAGPAGCASDRSTRGRARSMRGRIVVDGRPVAFAAGDSRRGRDPPGRRDPGRRRHAVPGRRLRQLPRPGRRRRLRPDVPGRRRGRGCRSCAIRRTGCRRCPSVSGPDLGRRRRPARTSRCSRGRCRCRRHRRRRQRSRSRGDRGTRRQARARP